MSIPEKNSNAATSFASGNDEWWEKILGPSPIQHSKTAGISNNGSEPAPPKYTMLKTGDALKDKELVLLYFGINLCWQCQDFSLILKSFPLSEPELESGGGSQGIMKRLMVFFLKQSVAIVPLVNYAIFAFGFGGFKKSANFLTFCFLATFAYGYYAGHASFQCATFAFSVGNSSMDPLVEESGSN